MFTKINRHAIQIHIILYCLYYKYDFCTNYVLKYSFDCTVYWHFLYFRRTESNGFERRRMSTTRHTSSDGWRVCVGMWCVPKRSYVLTKTKLRLNIRILLYCCNICIILQTETLPGPHIFLSFYSSAVVIGRWPQTLRPYLLLRVTYMPKQKLFFDINRFFAINRMSYIKNISVAIYS